MGFSGTAWSKLDQIIVFLDKRYKSEQIMEFLLICQRIRLITCRLKKQCDPFVFRKILTCLLDFIQVKIGHLNRFQRINLKRGFIF